MTLVIVIGSELYDFCSVHQTWWPMDHSKYRYGKLISKYNIPALRYTSYPSLCTYCGCNTRITKNHDVEPKYLDSVLRERGIYLDVSPGWGGNL